MQHKVVTALLAASAGLTGAPAHADRQGVCEDLDGLWSDRSEFVQITGRAACELTPESAGSTLLQLQYEYPSDVADDPSGGKQLTTYLASRIKFYQAQLAGGDGEIAVGVTYEEQSSGSSRTVVFTESAFTKGVRQPVTQKLTQTFTLSASTGSAVSESSAPTAEPDGSAPTTTVPTAPGTTIPSPAPSASEPSPSTTPAKPSATAPGAAPLKTPAPAVPAKPSSGALPPR
ncbi:hypothetical protein [Segniliparus rugosus]|uniref:Uncharacterized protein n=1 Tax=Segniliparus rugosus (strain ATCC BAA-974 / DSM 45345 / CCUG 50838 / CIP 108380 / JCM 13579 / CDC 945) TaxID=679197 RepID=U1M1I4_SEGRC|nr:hypothetical protein [Segniliparus rugosus]ERG69242.1 hypothetical protein HMPREF9336_04133 [Segniliparus rugosus ATCC BAA-974]